MAATTNPNQTSELSVRAVDATPPAKTPKKPINWLVRHVGSNGKERRRLERVYRLLPNGNSEKNDARFRLKNTPKNFPVRKIHIDGRPSYVFEPHFQAGMQAYREAYAVKLKEVFDVQVIGEGNKSAPPDLRSVLVEASRAFVTKIIELTRTPAPVSA